MKLWLWDEGTPRPHPWLERRLQPWSKQNPNEVISYSQFAIFPTARDAREWARARKLTTGKPRLLATRYSLLTTSK